MPTFRESNRGRTGTPPLFHFMTCTDRRPSVDRCAGCGERVKTTNRTRKGNGWRWHSDCWKLYLRYGKKSHHAHTY